MMKPRRDRGLMMLELAIALAIVGIIASIAVPHLAYSTKKARAAACVANRHILENAMLLYMEQQEIKPGSTLPSTTEIAAGGFLSEVPACPAGGKYLWIDETVPENKVPKVGCSYHFWPALAPDEESDPDAALFEPGFDNWDGLNKVKGSWALEDGILTPVGGKKGSNSNMLTFGDSGWDDINLALTANNDKGSGYNLYYRGALNGKGNKFESGYALQYNPKNGKFVVRPVENGKFQKPIAKYKMPKDFPKRTQPHDVSINAEGSRHTVSVNGDAIMSFDDGKYNSGISGISSGKGNNNFSDLRVTKSDS